MQNVCGKEISVLKLLRLKGFIHQLKKKKTKMSLAIKSELMQKKMNK